MKIKAILFALALSGVSAFGQGLVTFQNSNVGGTSIRLTTEGGGLMPAGGQAYGFFFRYGSSLQYTSQTYFNHETQAGRITTTGTSDIELPNAPGGVATLFQMYAYFTSYGSFENAQAYGAWYLSGIITVTPSTSPTPGAPLFGTTPGSTFQGFTWPVPEPSTIALGVLGAGSLLLFRRRK